MGEDASLLRRRLSNETFVVGNAMKIPKNITKYDSSVVAGMKLMQLVSEAILGCKDGIKVHWSIRISYWHDDWASKQKLAKSAIVAVPESREYSNL
jgi:hypothetical protein